MLQKQHRLAGNAQLVGRLLNAVHAQHQMAQQQALPAVVPNHAHFVGVHFLRFAQVMQDHARQQQVGVQPGVLGQDGLRQPEHPRGVVQKPAPLRMVDSLGGGVVQQLFPKTIQHFPGDEPERLAGKAVGSVVELLQHGFRRFRGAGGQQGQIDGVASASPRMRSTRSCRRPLYSSVVPRILMTVPGAGQGVLPSHTLALTSPVRSVRFISRYLAPLPPVR